MTEKGKEEFEKNQNREGYEMVVAKKNERIFGWISSDWASEQMWQRRCKRNRTRGTFNRDFSILMMIEMKKIYIQYKAENIVVP